MQPLVPDLINITTPVLLQMFDVYRSRLEEEQDAVAKVTYQLFVDEIRDELHKRNNVALATRAAKNNVLS